MEMDASAIAEREFEQLAGTNSTCSVKKSNTGTQLLRRATSGFSADGSELSFERSKVDVRPVVADRDTPQASDDELHGENESVPVPIPSMELLVHGGRPSVAPTAATASVVGGTVTGDTSIQEHQRLQS